MLRTLTKWFDARRRKLDTQILFPEFRRYKQSQGMTSIELEHGILWHMQHDPAWANYFSNEQLQELARQYANDTD